MTLTLSPRLGAIVTGIILTLVVAIPAFAEETASGTSSTDSTKWKKQVNLSCMQNAVGTRETAVANAYDAHTTRIKTALSERKTDLLAAWGITNKNERRTALKAAWKDYRDTRIASRTTFVNERKAAWATFKNTAKTECKVSVPKEEGEANDTDA